MDAELIQTVCDLCGGDDHATEQCPDLGESAQQLQALTQTLARQTLPSNLAIVYTQGKCTDVLCKQHIDAKVKLGPFIAKKVSEGIKHAKRKFVLKIFLKDGTFLTLDTSNENECNWLCLVQTAKNETEQNCVAFQLGSDIYYRTTREILSGELLKVWYAPGYAKKIGRTSKPDVHIQIMLGNNMDEIDATSDTEDECKEDDADVQHISVSVYVYPCDMCDNVMFSSETELIEHKKQDHNLQPGKTTQYSTEEGETLCSRCTLRFPDSAQLAIHIRDSHLAPYSQDEKARPRKRTWPCSQCGVVFSNPRGLGTHRKLHHTKENSPPLTENNEQEDVEESEETFNEPELSLDETNYGRGKRKRYMPRKLLDTDADIYNMHDCPHCADIFTSEESLTDHIAAMHNFQCQQCKIEFISLEGREKHSCRAGELIVGIEPYKNGDTYLCFFCPNSFIDAKEFHDHLIWHSKSLPCEVCKGHCSSVSALENHVKTCCGPPNLTQDSGPVEKITCAICSMEFSVSTALLPHMSTHTDFKCEKCGAQFGTKFGLQEHIIDCFQEQLALIGPVYSCELCKAILASQFALDYHMKEHQREGFQCVDCQKTFSLQAQFEGHDCDAPISDAFKCDICDKCFSTNKNLAKHLIKHTITFSCQICQKVYERKEELIKHSLECSAKDMLSRLGQINCPQCSEVFWDTNKYRLHLAVHTNFHSCKKCGKKFKKKGLLSCHVSRCQRDDSYQLSDEDDDIEPSQSKIQKRHSEGGAKYTCPVCSQAFGRIDTYKSHICRNEEGMVMERPADVDLLPGDLGKTDTHVCFHCGKIFISISNLNKHLKLHGDKEFQCDVCNKSFYQIHAMKLHYDSVHTDKLKVQCQTCEKVFRNKYSLTTHIKQFHAPHITIYACELCGKKFRQKGNMMKHMSAHDPSRRYHCEYCPKSYKYPEQLKRHELLHTQGKTLACDQCDRKYVRPFELKKHMREMHSNKIYVCQLCSETCRWRHTMRRHIKRKHPSYSAFADDSIYLASLLRSATEVESQQQASKQHTQAPVTVVSMDSLTPEQIVELQLADEQSSAIGEGSTITLYGPGETLPHSAAEALQRLSESGINNQHLTINQQQYQISFTDGQTVLTPIEMIKDDTGPAMTSLIRGQGEPHVTLSQDPNATQVIISEGQETVISRGAEPEPFVMTAEQAANVMAAVSPGTMIPVESTQDIQESSGTMIDVVQLAHQTQDEIITDGAQKNYVFFNLENSAQDSIQQQ